MTRAEKVIRFIEKYLVVPEGDLVGRPIKLLPFQIEFIRAVYDNPHVTDTAILSIARKNAKTATIAMLVLVHLVGSEAKQNSRIYSGALSRDQAGEVYNLASKMVQLSPDLSKICRVIPSGKKILGLPMGTEYQATSAEAKTAHGKSGAVVILDEIGQIRGSQSDFVDAMTTSQAAYDNPLLFVISTQAPNDADLMSIYIDDARKNKHPKTVCHVYEADPDCDVMDEEQWKKANPALGYFRSFDDMKKQAEKAKRMPSFENTFRNLNLNQRVAVHSSFISKSAWMACHGDVPDISEMTELYGGLDLSGKLDLTSFVLYGYFAELNKWFVYAWFWTPEKGLIDRAKRDKAPYDVWVKDGFIQTTPSATVDYEYVAKQLYDICDELPIVKIAFDRWRMDILIKELDKIGFSIPIEPFGQGFKDMAPALDKVEADILDMRLVHDNNPVMNMCMNNSVIVKNPAGDRKLEKMKISGRIDGSVALCMAAGVAQMTHEDQGSFDSFLNDPLSV